MSTWQLPKLQRYRATRYYPVLSCWARRLQGRPPAGGVAMTRVRPATPTVAFIDKYCAKYRSLSHNVGHCEHFTAWPLGLLAETRHKSLPRLGTTVHADPQALPHFLANADWSVEAVRTQRLELLRQALGDTPFILCLDETGDRKQGHTTASVAHQSIGHLHTLAKGVVAGTAEHASGVLTARHDDVALALPRLHAPHPPQSGRRLDE